MNNRSEHEAILSRFRDWLDQTRAECAALDDPSGDDQPPGDPIGLYQLAEQLTALRHDVRLLTKASRSVEERNEATLVSMNAAIEQFRAAGSDRGESGHKAARALVETIVELDESVVRGRQVIEQARLRVLEEWHVELQEVRERLDALYGTQPWWRRVLIRPWHQAARDVYSGNAAETGRKIFDSLLEGYELIQNRLRRAMQDHGIQRMECLGKPVDPHCMTVVEVVSDPTRRPGIVVEEVRVGYHWDGSVLRFAEVKAVAQR
jgi:molecular chaperone GrpE